ncbi:MAG: protein lplB [Paenibacillaceae bacterium]|jgi:putative aldouronate transport system permease protein|nr:protein lplB [Paenibacillaceae bacterium]
MERTFLQAARKYVYRDRYLYLMLIPVAAYYILFKFAPLFGEIIAFKNYRIVDGIWGSEWVGLLQFERLFQSSDFLIVLRNTLLLNVYSLVFQFPMPIVLAVLLNEVKHEWFKKILQNMLYVPYFISWVVLGGIITAFLSPSTGVVNTVLHNLFGIEPIFFLANSHWWPFAYIFSGVWQSVGFGTILYMAAMSGIDPQLYEAAKMDGAGKLRQIWHITLPGIRSTIVILLILRMGNMMDVGFEQINVLQNPAVYNVSDVISTYVYRIGIMGTQYSLTTALGLFQSIISIILIVSTNKMIKAFGERGLF